MPFSWPGFVGGLLLALLGWRVGEVLRDDESALSQHAKAVEVMQTRLSEDRHAVDTLADGLDVAIFICDPKAIVQYANRRATEMFRFPDPVGRAILAVTLSYDLEALLLETFRSGEPMQAELSFSYPDERVNVASAWIEDGSSRIFLAIYEITDLRRLERVRRDFVANVSHELRTPLASIRAMAETLHEEEKPDPDLTKRFLGKMISEVDRLSLLTNDLLILSAAESNPVRKQACDIAELFRSVTQSLERKAKEKGLSLTIEAPESLRIEANSAQMMQVALNLVDNALNYTTVGGVTVKVRQNEPQLVIIEVIDTGIGISSQHIERVFERFYRVDKGRSRVSGGTGLGLSIVKHLVESHGGKVEVDSALNEGSTFRIILPVGEADSLSEN